MYDFADNVVPGSTERDRGYWRDVGTLDAYYEAHMDLISVQPVFNLYNGQLADLHRHDPLPPAKFVHNEGDRVGHGDGVARVARRDRVGRRRAALDPVPRRGAALPLAGRGLGADGHVKVGRGAIVRKAIIDKNVVIPDGARIGFDLEYDRQPFRGDPNGMWSSGRTRSSNGRPDGARPGPIPPDRPGPPPHRRRDPGPGHGNRSRSPARPSPLGNDPVPGETRGPSFHEGGDAFGDLLA